MIKTIVEDICRRKREQRIDPALASEIEIKRELSRRGVHYTAESFRQMLTQLEATPGISVRRLRNYKGYDYETIHNTRADRQADRAGA
jgi:hypothetical protein